MGKKTYAIVGLLVLFAGAQLVPVAKTNPPIDPGRTIEVRTQLTPAAAAAFERACNDCHSQRTVWPWYSRIAPVSWLVSHDVEEGRGELNLSDWSKYDPQRAERKLRQICEEVRKGDMPLWYYQPLHPQSRLSAQDREAVCAWTDTERGRLKQGF